jgi:dTDP-4-dehydrorhamnose 3,5-epimerase-like enzyme
MLVSTPAPLKLARLIKLPFYDDERGGLVFMEAPKQIPFPIKRFFLIHHVTPGTIRGQHAHRVCHQFLLMTTGSATVEIDDGCQRRREILDSPAQGLYVPPMIWLDLVDFSADAALGVLASEPYDEADYIRDYDRFKAESGLSD